MKFILLFIIILNCSFEENIFLNIKKLEKEKYSVILNDGLYIYNSDFSKIIKDNKFSIYGITNNDNIILESFKDNYVICFLYNKVIIFYAETNEIQTLTYNNYDQNIKNYYNLIPYDIQKQKISFAIIYEEQYNSCNWWTICIAKNQNYKIVFSFNYFPKKNYEYQDEEFKDNSILMSKPICHLKSDFSEIKCYYYRAENNYYFSYVIFNSKNKEKVKNENCFNLNKNNVKKIESSISENNKVLLCILSNYQSYNSYCYINNWDNDLYLIQCTYNSCEDIKVFYYKETNQFSFVCKQSNKFIIYYINDTEKINNFICNKKETILINCDNNQKYNGAFSLIYNDSINYYNIITDYNFTKLNQICSFNYPEKKIQIILNTTNGTNISDIIYFEEEDEESEFMNFPDFFAEEEFIGNSIKESIKNYSNEENNENENIEISPEYILNNKNDIIK